MARRTRRAVLVAAAEPAGDTVTDPVLTAALEDALERIRDLATRLWAVRAQHRPGRVRFGRLRCAGCDRPYPCVTVQIAGLSASDRAAC